MTFLNLIKETLIDPETSSYIQNIEKQIGDINGVMAQNPALANTLGKQVGGANTQLQSLKAYLAAKAEQKAKEEEEAKKAAVEQQKQAQAQQKVANQTAGIKKTIPGEKVNGPLGPQASQTPSQAVPSTPATPPKA